MEIRRIRLAIDSDPANVGLVGAAVHAVCAETSLSPQQCRRVELCVVEAVNNCIRHAYRGRPGQEIAVTARLFADRLVIEVRDTGEPMPARALEAARSAGEPEPLAEGGRGVAIIKAVMDEVEYRSDAGVNTLTLTKRLDGAA